MCQVVFRCSDPAEDVYIVRSGSVKLLAHPDDVRVAHKFGKPAPSVGAAEHADDDDELKKLSMFNTLQRDGTSAHRPTTLVSVGWCSSHVNLCLFP